jgi:hypothetical protein
MNNRLATKIPPLADSGFDVKRFIENNCLIANIKENKQKTDKYRYMSDYIYSFQFKMECVFSCLGTYTKNDYWF